MTTPERDHRCVPKEGERTFRCAIIPCSGEDLASSRIRAFTLHRSLGSLGVPSSIGLTDDADLVFVQKRWDWLTIRKARAAKARGSSVWFDLDDFVEADPPGLRRMLELADVVTTDTDGHRGYISSRYHPRVIEVIPDSVDYYPDGPVPACAPEGDFLRLLWFGSASSSRAIGRYLPVLRAMDKVRPVMIIHPADIPSSRARFPDIHFLPWSPATFVRDMRSCHLSCLAHDSSEIDRMKSNNKMIASITWGVPAVVSDTPEYGRTAAESGVGTAVFRDVEGLRRCVELLRPAEARRRYLETAQPRIWDRYAPRTVALLFRKLALTHLDAARHRPGNALPAGAARRHFEDMMDLIAAGGWKLRRAADIVARSLGKR